jgi:hypothetical protein
MRLRASVHTSLKLLGTAECAYCSHAVPSKARSGVRCLHHGACDAATLLTTPSCAAHLRTHAHCLVFAFMCAVRLMPRGMVHMHVPAQPRDALADMHVHEYARAPFPPKIQHRRQHCCVADRTQALLLAAAMQERVLVHRVSQGSVGRAKLPRQK